MHLLLLWASLAGLYAAPSASAQSELFPGEQQLAGCALHMPLTYLKKDMPAALSAARAHQNEELVLVSYHPQTHQLSTQRVYVLVFTNKAGKEIIYQESAAEHRRPSATRKTLFARLNPLTDRYYTAACFDETVAASPALQALLLPSTATNALGR